MNLKAGTSWTSKGTMLTVRPFNLQVEFNDLFRLACIINIKDFYQLQIKRVMSAVNKSQETALRTSVFSTLYPLRLF